MIGGPAGFRSAHPHGRAHAIASAVAIAILAISIAACGATPEPSGPLGPCGNDANSIGGYPELEALLPRMLDGKAPDNVNSGRNCSTDSLGTLTTHGIHELRFAGAT